MDNLPHDAGYLVGFKSKFITGLPLRICVKNLYNNICVAYEELGKHSASQWDFFSYPSNGYKYWLWHLDRQYFIR
jgi:hypothetical protein